MKVEESIENLGLSSAESRVYTFLVEYTDSSVIQISKGTNLNRTAIYDVLSKLKKRGFVSSIHRNNKQLFHAISLKNIISYFESELDGLKELAKSSSSLPEKNGLKLEIYENKKGFSLLIEDMLREKGEYLCFGLDEQKWHEEFQVLSLQYLKKWKQIGMKGKIVTSNHAVYRYEDEDYRFVDKLNFMSLPWIVYGTTICFILWEPLQFILLRNKDIAESYKKQFNLLWKTAQKLPITRLKKLSFE